MPKLYDVYFASSNKHKYEEAKKILANFGINLKFFKCNLEEIQSDSIKEIAAKKAIDAFTQCKKPVIIEDDGIFIKSLGGFPGPYSSYVYNTIGNNGILKLVGKNRQAGFHAVISYCDKKKIPFSFTAIIKGKIPKKQLGKGWGFDPIFIPNGLKKTYGQISNKNQLSHRYKALKKFANWFVNMQESNDQ